MLLQIHRSPISLQIVIGWQQAQATSNVPKVWSGSGNLLRQQLNWR